MTGSGRWAFSEGEGVTKMKDRKKRPATLLHLFSALLILGMILPLFSLGRAEQKPTLAILPFFIEKGEETNRGALCPICKAVYRKGEILASGPIVLQRLLYPKMGTLNFFEITPAEKVEEVLSSRRRQEVEQKPLSSSLWLGKEMNVEFLLVGFLYRFEERVGSSLGVEKPASVGFDLHLIRIRDGKAVWEGKFDETQQPLSENVLRIGAFLRRKASWLTAEELASVGVDEMLSRFPGLKGLEE
jgi:hypothetical protein